MLPGLLLLVGLSQAAPAAQVAATPTADELIARVRDRYGHCRTYRDDTRESWIPGEDEDSTAEECRYLFALERPRRFRIERGNQSRWEYVGREVLWRDHDDLRQWMERQSEPSPSRFDLSDFGSSDLYKAWILPLLDLPDVPDDLARRSWRDAHPTGAVTREATGGIACWRVGVESKELLAQIWIDDGAAIRRIVIGRSDGASDSRRLDLAPEFDVELDPADLALSPPGRSGVKPSTVMHVLEILAFVTMGTIGILLGLRLHRTGRPFTVSSNLFGWFAVIVAATELFGRFVDHLDVILHWNAPALVMAGLIALCAWPLLKHVRRQFGFHIVGVDHSTFLAALRSVVAGLQLQSKISAATPKVTIDGRSFEVAMRPTWSMYGLLTRERTSLDLLSRLRSLVSACFESTDLPTHRRAGLRIISWSSAMIVGAIVVGSILTSVFDFV
jgi:hypothetical protein